MIQLNPISITATAQSYCSSITEDLCQPFCLSQNIQPVSNVVYSVAGINAINGVAYVTVQATGNVQYMPKGSCGCCPHTRMFVETFDVAFTGTGTPTVVITYAPGTNGAANVRCGSTAYAYNIVGEVTITATFPA